MAAYHYIALDNSGLRQKGVMEADSPRQLRQQLRDRSLAPVEIREVARGQKRISFEFRRNALGLREVSVFTRQLATLVGAGLTVESALQTLARQGNSVRYKGVISSIRTQLMEGRSLSESLAAFPQVFSDMYRTTIAAGERTGHLDAVLSHLADFTEESYRARQKVMLALLYPAILTAISFVIVAFLLAFVVPDMIRVFTDAGRALPFLTRALIVFSNGLSNWWFLLPLLAVALFLGVRKLLSQPETRLALDRKLLTWPLIGAISLQHNTARFSATLGMLQESAVPLVQALEIAGAVLTNRHLRNEVIDMTRQVSEGRSLSAALEAGNIFPPLLSTMVASGEASGQLGLMLTRASAMQQRDLENRVAVLLGLFEPMVLLVMGGIVLLLVLAIVLPILNLNQLVL